MRRNLLLFAILVSYFQCSRTERKILGGKRTPSEKSYMAYFVKSNISNLAIYDTWMCAGSIVSPQHILTSGACLFEVSHLYAVVGYSKYVRSEMLDDDPCTKNRKQRVVKTCLPHQYEFNYADEAIWMVRDIGLAVLEKPLDFTDKTYRLDCHYTPKPIKIFYNKLEPELNYIDCVIYGWGHTQGLRQPGDTSDYNMEYLREASTTIRQSYYCADKFDKKMTDIIYKFMLCGDGVGQLDGEGEFIDFQMASRSNECNDAFRRNDPDCGEDYFDGLRRQYNATNKNKKRLHKKSHNLLKRSRNNTGRHRKKLLNRTEYEKVRWQGVGSRKQGAVCQNDHGSPIVTWQGADEVVVGVASASLYDKWYTCIGPSLYTSVHCVSRFLRCGVAFDDLTRRSCDGMGPEEGYELREYIVPWGDASTNAGHKTTPDTQKYNTPSNTENVASSLIQDMKTSSSSSALRSSNVSSSTSTSPSPLLSLLKWDQLAVWNNFKTNHQIDLIIASREDDNNDATSKTEDQTEQTIQKEDLNKQLELDAVTDDVVVI